MAWKELSVDELAASLRMDPVEAQEKQRLMRLIVKARIKIKLSQAKLARKVGITQGRIAQIESGVGTRNVTFDVLLNILSALGYEFKIVLKQAA